MTIKKMELPEGWYPKDRVACEDKIQRMIISYPEKNHIEKWVGGIVPHAGWYYSGKLACQVIHQLSQSQNPDVVIIFGGHLRADANVTYYDYDQFETPLGYLERNLTLYDLILPCIQKFAEADDSMDNTIEVQLPLIKYFFPNAKILAFRSPPAHKAMQLGKLVAEQGKKLGLNLVFLGSTDLTHYGPNYNFTSQGKGDEALNWVKGTNDQEFIHYLTEMSGELAIKHSIRHHSACSAGAAASCIASSHTIGKNSGELVDYYTSYDVSKNSSFVGYVGMLY